MELRGLNRHHLILIALAPAVLAAVSGAGLDAVMFLLAAVAGGVLAGVGVRRFASRPVRVKDGSAVATGLLVGLLVPSSAPLWVPAVGAGFGVAVVTEAFGGRDRALFHPAVTAWLFLSLAFSRFVVTGSEPLVEAAPLTLLLGGAVLLAFRREEVWGPAGLVAVTAATAILGGPNVMATGFFALLCLFVVSDPVTTPAGAWGRFGFGVGVGGLAVLYAGYGAPEEALVLSVVLMNAVAPWFDRAETGIPRLLARRVPEGEEG